MTEKNAWRRGFAAGFLMLALAVAGQVATSSGAAACPLAAQPGVVEQVIARLKPALQAHGGVAQRVALAVLGAVVHSTCS